MTATLRALCARRSSIQDSHATPSRRCELHQAIKNDGVGCRAVVISLAVTRLRMVRLLPHVLYVVVVQQLSFSRVLHFLQQSSFVAVALSLTILRHSSLFSALTSHIIISICSCGPPLPGHQFFDSHVPLMKATLKRS